MPKRKPYTLNNNKSKNKTGPLPAVPKAPALFPFSHELLGTIVLGLGLYIFLAFLTPYAGEAGKLLKENAIKFLGLGSLLIPSYLGMIGTLAFQYRRVHHLTLAVKFLLYSTWLIASLILLAIAGQGGTLTTWCLGTKEFLGPIGSLIAVGTIVLLLSFSITGLSLKRTIIKLMQLFIYLVLLPVKLIQIFFKKINKKLLPRADITSNSSEELKQNILANPPKMTLSIEEPFQNITDSCKDNMENSLNQPQQEEEAAKIEIKEEQDETTELNIHPNDKKNTEYRLPHPAIFAQLPINSQEKLKTNNTQNAANQNTRELLENTLKNFGVEAHVIHMEQGPTVTRYELQPAKGVTVRKIVALGNDLALALAAISLRIEAPIPGKSAIGIEVPNPVPTTVSLYKLLEHSSYRNNPSNLAIPFGCDITGKPVVADLAKMPHLLIAGATGSGKTVCVNAIIASILFKATPDQVQFLMIDPKRVELTMYSGIPHLVREVVTDPKLAARALTEAVSMMDHRYDSFAKERVRNIAEYNAIQEDNPMPNLVIIIDELAELMSVAAVMVETSIARLTATARAAGIHLIVATQRPSVDVITGTIKSNIPSRIAFAVSSQVDSRTILDSPGAEKLLGRGDMLFLPIEASKPIRVQGTFISREEIEILVDFWSRQALPANRLYIPLDTTPDTKQEEKIDDELYESAKDIILSTGQASVSILQRKMKIGYARAGRLIDILERRGIVGPADGSKPRKILVPASPSIHETNQ